MRVSVIIPTRNMGDLLSRAIDSVQAQTVPAHEIVVADDGSTDETEGYLARLKHGVNGVPVHSIRNYTSNRWGVSGGRNTAAAISKGEVILPLDADDWIDPFFLERTLAVMKEDPEVGIVSTLFTYHGEKEGLLCGYAYPRTYEQQLKENRITVCSLIRREALDQAGEWDMKAQGWEDWDMWLRILKLGWKHGIVKQGLFHYRLHKGGMNQWANDNKERLLQYMRSKHSGFME